MTGARFALAGALAASAVALAAGLTANSDASAASATQRPCDLYAAGGTPCVAAHSTTRALYAAYNGPLYQVRRASDGATRDIGVLRRGGYADAASQDAFCAATTCVISVVFDQSSHHNDLTQAPPGGFNGPEAGGYDALADATAAPVKVAGHRAYGIYVTPGVGYRDNDTDGVATGDDPEGMYALLDGTHFNGGCCFDYGNAETDSHDDGNGTMEAIYFGNNTFWGSGPGNGPWIMADLENGLFSGVHTHYNANDPTIDDRFTTAMIKGSHDEWAIRGGNAQTGTLDTFYNGARPNEVDGYDPMQKQGAIILGIGGDNSVSGAGTFYEGVMTSGYPSQATEDAVQADITAAKYVAVKVPPPALDPGPQVSVQTAAGTSRYLEHDTASNAILTQVLRSTSPKADRQEATFVEAPGLANSSCVSFESAYHPGSYLRHYAFKVSLQANEKSSQFAQDATFCPTTGNSGRGTSFRSVNYVTKYLRVYQGALYLASNDGANAWDDPANYAADTSFLVGTALAP